MEFKVNNLPDGLPPGDYDTRIVSAEWVGRDIVVELDYVGPIDPAAPRGELGLFPLHVAELFEDENTVGSSCSGRYYKDGL